jgi:hypothetical protein
MTMMMNNAYVNKNLYKVFISTIKFIPNFLAVTKILGLFLSHIGIQSFLVTCIGGTSIAFLVLLYLISHVFKFCSLYRLSLNYVTLITCLSMIDWYIGIPISTEAMWELYTINSGVFMTSWIVIWYKNRKNPKIDHIKQLCDTYSDCNC